MTSDNNDNDIKPLNLEELINAGRSKLTRILELDVGDGETFKRKVVFRRLTFAEIAALESIPKDDTTRYSKAAIKVASIEPAIGGIDQLDSAPHGFVRSYGNIIIRESGKDPFL